MDLNNQKMTNCPTSSDAIMQLLLCNCKMVATLLFIYYIFQIYVSPTKVLQLKAKNLLEHPRYIIAPN